MEQPPEEASNTEVPELYPFVSDVGGVNAEVAKDEGRNYHGREEPNVEGVH